MSHAKWRQFFLRFHELILNVEHFLKQGKKSEVLKWKCLNKDLYKFCKPDLHSYVCHTTQILLYSTKYIQVGQMVFEIATGS